MRTNIEIEDELIQKALSRPDHEAATLREDHHG
jgi:Arc/MetJ family transcription regulator